MTKEERLKQIMEIEEFAFLKEIPSDKLWKLMFALCFIMGTETERVHEDKSNAVRYADIHNL